MVLQTETVETLEAAALQLTPADRARLVDRLIATLDVDPEVEEAWAAEVERRQAEIEKGTVSLLPAPGGLGDLRDAASFYHDRAGTSLSQSFLAEFEQSINKRCKLFLTLT